MGCDIHGWVEINPYKDDPWWSPCIEINSILGRNYDMFGLLFGVRNYATFNPIAENRGIPKNASSIVKNDIKEWGIDAHSASYLTFTEISGINWDAKSIEKDERIHEYRKTENGEEFSVKYSWGSGLEGHEEELRETGRVEIGDRVYKLEYETAKEALSSDWKFLFELMEKLAERYGDSNVRLIVWFDN